MITGITFKMRSERDKSIGAALHLILPVNVERFAQNSTPRIIIGAKPISTPLPKKLLDDMAAVSAECGTLGSDILSFSDDTTKERTRLQLASPPEGKDWTEWEQRSQEFSEQAAHDYERQFSSRVTRCQVEFDAMGIVMPYMVFEVSSSQPRGVGKWFATISRYVAQSDLQQARTIGADDDFWFNQLN